MTGKFFGSFAPAGDKFFKILSMIDVAFHVGVVLLFYWAFGFRVMAVATVFWGCNAPANFYWTGGAFLRQDWLFFLIAALCCARKRKFFLAGGALTWSALLPGLADGTQSRRKLAYLGASTSTLRLLKPSFDALMSQGAMAVERIALTELINRRTSEDYFRTLIQSASDVIFIIDERDQIQYASPSAVVVFGRPDLLGTPVPNLITGADRGQLRDMLTRIRNAASNPCRSSKDRHRGIASDSKTSCSRCPTLLKSVSGWNDHKLLKYHSSRRSSGTSSRVMMTPHAQSGRRNHSAPP